MSVHSLVNLLIGMARDFKKSQRKGRNPYDEFVSDFKTIMTMNDYFKQGDVDHLADAIVALFDYSTPEYKPKKRAPRPKRAPQCPVTYDGVRCELPPGHQGWHVALGGHLAFANVLYV